MFKCEYKWIFFVIILKIFLGNGVMADWRNANRDSVGIAPDPSVDKEAIIQVYSARAFGWRGFFGTHTWFAVKPSNASKFTVYEVIGWRLMRGEHTLAISNRIPDGRWFGNDPEVIAELRGQTTDNIIKKLDKIAKAYPHKNSYRVWPGPNSNTFIAYVARSIPELALDLPPTAIGKDFLSNGKFVASTPSGTGYQLSLLGLIGILLGKEEGLEINILGLTFGIDPLDLAIKIPFAGRVSVKK